MSELYKKAIEVLENNWRGRFSIPCAKLYPFQWFWDSGYRKYRIELTEFDVF